MKVSLKFRDEQRPVARAKIPISILGIPFLAGACAGNPDDLRLDITTAFESGPAFRVCYRPNEPSNPFSLVVKTGIGAFGSPVATPMSMITEFKILSSRYGSGCPAFSLIFKPRLGDFCFRKTASSPSPLPVPSRKIIPDEEMFPVSSLPMHVSSRKTIPDEEGVFLQSPSPAPFVNGIHTGGKVNGIAGDFPAAGGGIRGLVSGMGVSARSILPIGNRAEVGFYWGLQMPTELQPSFSAATFSMANLPMLVMNKISIKLIPAAARAKRLEGSGHIVSACEVAEACKSVRQDLAGLQAESEALRKAVEDIRDNINTKLLTNLGNKNFTDNEAAKGGWRAAVPEPVKRDRRNEVKSVPEDVNEELKKALMSAHATGK